MNTALIFAGGAGTRMNSKTKPKQFLELNGKAIIIHTLEYFEKNDEIDNIAVVCIAEWIDYLKQLLERNFITKVRWIVPGGLSGQESIYNGLKVIYDACEEPKETVVLIHDGVRPLINEQLIYDNITCAKKFGSAITITPQTETIAIVSQNNEIDKITDRKLCRVAKAPQSFILENIMNAHKKAIADGNTNMVDSASLMKYYGYDLHTVDGPMENIKITTPVDFYIFRAIYEARENSQIFGL